MMKKIELYENYIIATELTLGNQVPQLKSAELMEYKGDNKDMVEWLIDLLIDWWTKISKSILSI